MRKLEELLDMAKSQKPMRVVVADAAEAEVLAALEDARKHNIANGILIGDSEAIKKTAGSIGVNVDDYEIVEEKSSKMTARVAVEMLKRGEADVLMKGLVSTKDFMKAILDKEKGLIHHKSKKLLSHVAVFEVPAYHKLLTITDAAINIAPTLEEKVQIINNAIEVVRSFGIEKPKVACVAAVEKVNPGKMPATEDAAILTIMNRRGQIKGAIVDGPFGFDNAISRKAAEVKRIGGEVAGDADIVLFPDIESANVAYKMLQYFANSRCAAIVAGTPIPIVLTSRADPHETKFYSLVLGILMAQY